MQNLHDVMRISIGVTGGFSRRRGVLAGALAGVATVCWPGWAGAKANALAPVRVAAASDLKFALADVVKVFQQSTGQTVSVQLGSSGNFARQIRQGLPVDLFMSADEALVTDLVSAGLTRDAGALYAIGRIALIVPAGSSLPLDADLRALQDASVRKVAIANPDHAPYGRAAREVLQKLGLWERLQPKLVLGENIAQATQFVTTGAAQAGLSALSLAMAPELASQLRHRVLPDSLHAPLRQRMVLLRQASPQAEAFYDYLQSLPAKAVLESFGFVIPAAYPVNRHK